MPEPVSPSPASPSPASPPLSPPPPASPLHERFPALQRITFSRRRRRVPPVQQTTPSDCGAASLTMVLAYHGKNLRLDDVRKVTGFGRDGPLADKGGFDLVAHEAIKGLCLLASRGGVRTWRPRGAERPCRPAAPCGRRTR